MAEKLGSAADPLYLRIAEARLARELGDIVTEAELIRRFGVTRPAVRKAQAEDHLAIIAAIERGDYLTAASLVRNHLEDPKREKVLSDFPERKKYAA